MTTGVETAAASAAASAGVKRSLDLEHSSSTSHSDTDGMNILMGLPDGLKSFKIGLVV